LELILGGSDMSIGAADAMVVVLNRGGDSGKRGKEMSPSPSPSSSKSDSSE
jgi:hypothetical protein